MAHRRANRSDLVTAFAFARWAASLPRPPTKQEVQGVLQCTGATATRWRRLYLKSIGTQLPTPVGGNRHH